MEQKREKSIIPIQMPKCRKHKSGGMYLMGLSQQVIMLVILALMTVDGMMFLVNLIQVHGVYGVGM